MPWFNSINWQIFWEPQRLLLVKPSQDWPLEWWYIALIAANLLLALASLIFRRFLRPAVAEAMSTYGWSNAIVMAVFYFFRSQHIPYLGMDLLRTLHEVTVLIWGIILFRSLYKSGREEKAKSLLEQRRSKYLPKPKNLG